MRQRGSATVLAAFLVSIIVFVGLVLLSLVVLVGDRIAAQTAADAAALAAAPATFQTGGNPSRSAARLAELNGARLVHCECQIDRSWGARTVRVVVERVRAVPVLGSVAITAGASAEFDPLRALGG